VKRLKLLRSDADQVQEIHSHWPGWDVRLGRVCPGSRRLELPDAEDLVPPVSDTETPTSHCRIQTHIQTRIHCVFQYQPESVMAQMLSTVLPTWNNSSPQLTDLHWYLLICITSNCQKWTIPTHVLTLCRPSVLVMTVITAKTAEPIKMLFVKWIGRT